MANPPLSAGEIARAFTGLLDIFNNRKLVAPERFTTTIANARKALRALEQQVVPCAGISHETFHERGKRTYVHVLHCPTCLASHGERRG